MDAAAGKEVRLDGSTSRSRPSRAEEVYLRLKQDIASFRLVPGDRFTEGGICARLDVSRTPVRQALYRLQQEGYVEVLFRAGWRVLPIDFKKFEELYVLRRLLEVEAVRRLCLEPAAFLSERYDALAAIWLGPMEARETDSVRVGGLDEQFHGALVEAAGNAEIARVHRDVTEHIRIIRRLDFTWAARIESTYEEHGQILRAISAGRGEEACRLLSAHIVASQAEIRKITLNQIQMAKRQSLQSLGNAGDDDVGGAEDAPAGDVSGA
ncbi:GntR family transcriptional regulator [Corticibacter populi]|uniref:GntR family transcriptional regulator n=1 Tax=Corticibacter populi TaxID=1550736 RepID=A0A3M6QPW7_9BURK|nr:GntR family transcriptional regulator [Corticibacter populi]RMX05065.1 GntR family transcriptional regulator [Corticibacter populi]